MADITEYGDTMLNATIDEWGRRRTDNLLEDGVKILALVGAPIIKTWFNSLEVIHNFKLPKCAIKLAQALQVFHNLAVEVPTVIIKQWSASLKLLHFLRRPERKMLYTQALKPSHAFRKPIRVIKIPAPST